MRNATRILLALLVAAVGLVLVPSAASAEIPPPGNIAVKVDQLLNGGRPFEFTITSGWPETTGTQNMQLTDTGSGWDSWFSNRGKFKSLAVGWHLITQTPDPLFEATVACDTRNATVWDGPTDPNEVWVYLHEGGSAECVFTNREVVTATPEWVTAKPENHPGAPRYTWWNTDVTVDWNWSAYTPIGVQHCPPSTTSTGEGYQTVRATCTHLAFPKSATAATWNVRVDKTPDPAPIITAPILDGADAEFRFAAVPDGLSGVHRFQCQLDGKGWHDECHNPTSFSGIGHGEHTLEARVVDNAGNIGDTASFTWTL